MSKLREAIEAWIRAEFLFRLGPFAYEDEPTKWYLEAEDRMRKAVSGEADLTEAARAIGVEVDELEEQRRNRFPRRPVRKAPKPRTRLGDPGPAPKPRGRPGASQAPRKGRRARLDDDEPTPPRKRGGFFR